MTENPETAPVPEATEVLESQLAEEAFVPSPAKPRFPGAVSLPSRAPSCSSPRSSAGSGTPS